MCVQYIGGGGGRYVQYIGGYHEYIGRYHEYIGGCQGGYHEYIGEGSVHRRDTMSTSGDIMSTSGDIIMQVGDTMNTSGDVVVVVVYLITNITSNYQMSRKRLQSTSSKRE